MPYKFETDKIKLPKGKDRRVKLTEEERVKIKKLYGKISQRKLARAFHVSRRLIQFIGDPDKYKQDLQRRAERGGSAIYYDREKHTKAMRKHRRYKQKIMNK
ncbi:hypothetical protein GF336_07820 [Candidatus Woesearchaeota archaeon]|nr:hypothetical protein [Candidatus Woesearchaeota archaeon]